jgi:2,3-dihydroxybiphenyl 1,2-dioxygenase
MRNCAEHFRDDRDGMLDKSHHHLDLEIEPSKPTSVHLRCTLSAKHSIIDVFTHPRPKQDSIPFSPAHGMSGYKTGDLGLGHVVLVAEDPDETVKWYREMLGFKISDYIFWDGIEATFLHCNPRHHSLAFVNAVGPFNAGDLNHIMLEAESLDDIGRGYDTALENKVPVAMTLGRHSNDLTTSFYAVTPSGWWIEYGHGGRLIDDSVWEPKMYSSPKLWGHARQLPS